MPGYFSDEKYERIKESISNVKNSKYCRIFCYKTLKRKK